MLGLIGVENFQQLSFCELWASVRKKYFRCFMKITVFQLKLKESGYEISLNLIPSRLRGEVLSFPVKDKKGKLIVEEGRRITSRHIRQMETAKLTALKVSDDFLIGMSLAKDIVDNETGEVLFHVILR